jgi:dolichol-phosphate mannosyltransferase
MTQLAIVLPAYNEAEALPLLLSRLARVSDEHFHSALSVIVVDDGSSDGTAEAARCDILDARVPVRVITHPQNRGLSGAMDTGLRAALQNLRDDDIVLAMDADDTHNPGLIPRMAALIEEGNDLVIASRYQPGARVLGVPAARQLMSNGMSLLFRLVYPIPGARDYSCGFRAYRAGLLREAYARWGDRFISERGFSCMVDILIKLSLLGAIITEVPMILRYDRKPGKSKMNVRRTVTQTLSLLLRRRLGRLD